MLYQVATADELTLNTLCGFDEFSFGQDVSNSNPNELVFADELSKNRCFSKWSKLFTISFFNSSFFTISDLNTALAVSAASEPLSFE